MSLDSGSGDTKDTIGACDGDKTKKPTETTFAKPNLTMPLQRVSGIQAVEINAAREMVQLHTRSRAPPRGTTISERSMARNITSQSFHAPATSRPGATSSSSMAIGTTSGTQNTASTSVGVRKPSPSHSSTGSAHLVSVSVPARDHDGQCKNPQCHDCGLVIIPSPQSSYPIQDKPSITIKNWSIYTVKQPILSSPELDSLETRYNFPLPEMIFGNNVVRLVNDKTNATIEFNALEALDTLDDNCTLKVSYHDEWLQSRRARDTTETEAGDNDLKRLTEVDTLKPYDWTYSVNYKGTCSNLEFEETSEKFPVDRLLKPDPILFFDESVLFEDELADNGISMLSTKIRVMPTCMLLLCRFFLRIDNVIFRIRDVRIFIDFETDEVLRDYREQEYPYDELYSKVASNKSLNDPKKLLRDPNWVSQNIPVVKSSIELSKETKL
jgi:type 2A phosphatase activator TIP41